MDLVWLSPLCQPASLLAVTEKQTDMGIKSRRAPALEEMYSP